ncbi:MAG: SRPBCC family protein [Planctomycetaceae bacterium]
MAFFEVSVELACSPEVAFEFLIQPENIRLITPSAVMLVFDVAPQRLSLGARMEFRVQAQGVVRSAVHDVTAWDSPRRFVERQVAGPLGAWEHEHLFQPTVTGVRVTDRITFSPPSGLLGLLVNERKIRESLEEGFGHRHHELEKRFGSSEGAR